MTAHTLTRMAHLLQCTFSQSTWRDVGAYVFSTAMREEDVMPQASAAQIDFAFRDGGWRTLVSSLQVDGMPLLNSQRRVGKDFATPPPTQPLPSSQSQGVGDPTNEFGISAHEYPFGVIPQTKNPAPRRRSAASQGHAAAAPSPSAPSTQDGVIQDGAEPGVPEPGVPETEIKEAAATAPATQETAAALAAPEAARQPAAAPTAPSFATSGFGKLARPKQQLVLRPDGSVGHLIQPTSSPTPNREHPKVASAVEVSDARAIKVSENVKKPKRARRAESRAAKEKIAAAAAALAAAGVEAAPMAFPTAPATDGSQPAAVLDTIANAACTAVPSGSNIPAFDITANSVGAGGTGVGAGAGAGAEAPTASASVPPAASSSTLHNAAHAAGRSRGRSPSRSNKVKRSEAHAVARMCAPVELNSILLSALEAPPCNLGRTKLRAEFVSMPVLPQTLYVPHLTPSARTGTSLLRTLSLRTRTHVRVQPLLGHAETRC
ncbi:MAG: hypothetical protein EOO41_01470 [Methanobacteriota archaeon]|nr:MAG: hypothetical protein EOO41_01470 [Euryarchaeota archaeon]